MAARDIAMRLGFVVVVALLVGVVLSMPAISQKPASVGEPLTVESHQPSAILATAPVESGVLSAPAGEESKHVVIDTGHGNELERSNLAPMIEALTAAGHQVTFHQGSRETPLNESLRSADAFVVVEAVEPYSAAERRGLQAFSDAGGRVLLAVEPPSQGASVLSILGISTGREAGTAPMTGLAASYGFSVGDGYVYDLETYDTNYRNPYASPTGSADIGADAERVTLHEATTIGGGTTLLETTDTAVVSSDRSASARSVAARQRNVTVLGDASLLDREWIQRNDNEVFVSGILEFLVTGDKAPGAPTPQTTESGAGGGAAPPSGPPGQSA